MSEFDEPLSLSSALAELIARRGYARMEEHRRYHAAWKAVAGEKLLVHAQLSRVSRGQMYVEVDNAPLLSELTGFQSAELLGRLQAAYPALNIKGLKFRLKGLA
jgi:hypothetical protein